MERSKISTESNREVFYVGLISFTLFLCPILIFGISRIFALEQNYIGLEDIIMFGAYWISAGLVWSRAKFMWLTTIILLCTVILTTIVAMFKNISSDLSPIYVTAFILSITSFFAVLLLADYISSKTFDRRDQFSILGAAKRYSVNFPAELFVSNQQQLLGTITSLSFSGALFEFDSLPTPIYLKNCRLDIPELKFFGKQPVEFIEINSHKVRLTFKGFNLIAAYKLNQHLKSLRSL